jgi:iron(III) transport system ATP-binding protein
MMVSHEPADLLSWAETIMLMKDGKIIQQAAPPTVYLKPVNEYAAGLLGDYSLIDTSAIHFATEANRQQKLFLRPNQIKISTNGVAALKGIVEAVHYRGAYMLVDVVLQQQHFFALYAGRTLQKGEVVGFNIAADEQWFL